LANVRFAPQKRKSARTMCTATPLPGVTFGDAASRCPLAPDSVEKVENRTAPKISRKSIFSRLYRCKAPWRRYAGRWSFLPEMMWSLTSSRAKRISRPRNFRLSGEKDFFNTIPYHRTFISSRLGPLNRRQSLKLFDQDHHTLEEATPPHTRSFGRCLGRPRLPDWKAW
jgi:hypothetical protein